MTSSSLSYLGNLLEGELQRHRAIVHIDNLRKEERAHLAHLAGAEAPLVERMDEFPIQGVDLKNIVEFPPKMALIPVKPIFLDVAWNYIDYPGKTRQQAPAAAAAADTREPAQQQKKGWFGFGR